MTNSKSSIVWFRHDLRLDDNPALHTAVKRGGAVVPVFVWAPAEEGDWSPGGASRWWLHQSLARLDADLQKVGSRLVLRHGDSLDALKSLIQETGADAVFWNRRYEPKARQRDERVESALRADGLTVETFNASLLFEPCDMLNKQGNPYQVFTPFWKVCLALPAPPKPLPAPSVIARDEATKRPVASLALDALKLEPRIDWAAGIRTAWTPGENGARAQLRRFVKDGLAAYRNERDRPDCAGTSRLSPHLHFGEISLRQIWHAVQEAKSVDRKASVCWGAESYLRELGWREFAHHLLYHFPHTPDQPLRPEFARFPWRADAAALKAWQRGHTGYPFVDAGMRELWTTGWMHNRVRMVVASFLVKDLLVPWQVGAQWFWDTLVDADLANNTLGWQWTAGCGADAAPFFRIFHPVTQGQKFDPDGDYVRRWVPELAKLPKAWIHKPWDAPPDALADAGVESGKTYPTPIVDHAAARKRALAALETIKKV